MLLLWENARSCLIAFWSCAVLICCTLLAGATHGGRLPANSLAMKAWSLHQAKKTHPVTSPPKDLLERIEQQTRSLGIKKTPQLLQLLSTDTRLLDGQHSLDLLEAFGLYTYPTLNHVSRAIIYGLCHEPCIQNNIKARVDTEDGYATAMAMTLIAFWKKLPERLQTLEIKFHTDKDSYTWRHEKVIEEWINNPEAGFSEPRTEPKDHFHLALTLPPEPEATTSLSSPSDSPVEPEAMASTTMLQASGILLSSDASFSASLLQPWSQENLHSYGSSSALSESSRESCFSTFRPVPIRGLIAEAFIQVLSDHNISGNLPLLRRMVSTFIRYKQKKPSLLEIEQHIVRYYPFDLSRTQQQQFADLNRILKALQGYPVPKSEEEAVFVAFKPLLKNTSSQELSKRFHELQLLSEDEQEAYAHPVATLADLVTQMRLKEKRKIQQALSGKDRYIFMAKGSDLTADQLKGNRAEAARLAHRLLHPEPAYLPPSISVTSSDSARTSLLIDRIIARFRVLATPSEKAALFQRLTASAWVSGNELFTPERFNVIWQIAAGAMLTTGFSVSQILQDRYEPDPQLLEFKVE